MKDCRLHISFSLQNCIVSILLISATAGFFAYQSYTAESSRKALILAREILSIVKIRALQINLDLHEEVFFNPDEGLQGKSEFDRIQAILAAIRDANNLAQCLVTGMSDYLSKPVDHDPSHEMLIKWMSPNENLKKIS